MKPLTLWPLKIGGATVDTDLYYAELHILLAPIPPHVEGNFLYSDSMLTIKNKADQDLYFRVSDISVTTETDKDVIARDAAMPESVGFEVYRIKKNKILQLHLHSSSRLPGETYFLRGIDFGDETKQSEYIKWYNR